ncbi:polysaccharide lyase family 7 protein [Pararhizobium antarcticum]
MPPILKVSGRTLRPQIKPSQVPVTAKTASSTSIDLSYWKLTLPVNNDGIVSGVGDATERTDLLGFAMPPYFEVASNSISFMAPTNGARTGGSNYPRSELREMDGQGDEYQWRIADGGHLAATLVVDELPMTSASKPGRIIIGQIHGPDDELCRLYFDNGKLYFMDDKAGEAMEETQFDLVDTAGNPTNIRLGDEFSYTIDVDGKSLVVSATHEGTTYSATDIISRFWVDKDLYFKAGAYIQVGKPGSKARAVGTGQGKVTFTALTRPTHDIFRKPSAREIDQDDDSEG